MVNFGTTLRNPTTGNVFATIPFDQWLFYEYVQKLNAEGRCQGILSPFKSPEQINTFNMENGERTDYILEQWFRPYKIAFADNTKSQFYLDDQYLVRYQRLEHLNDGRPRDTFIGRGKMDLLKRCVIIPPQEPLAPPYKPNSPWRVPPHEFISNTFPDPIPSGAGVWTLPVTESYDGSFPVPSTQFIGTSTAHRMCQLVEYAKKYLNINTLGDITIANPPTNGGLADHPIDIRYDNLLSLLQSMSAATWHGWFYGNLGAGRLPVDFDLVPDPNKKNGWIFTVFSGGRGVDRTIDGVMGGGAEQVVLSTANDNIIQPVSVRDRTQEKTRVYVGGKNNGTARDVIAVVDLDRATVSPWNMIDKFIHSSKIRPFTFDGSPLDGIPEAVERGQARLEEESPRNNYTVILRFNRTLRKGVNLAVGDLVSANLFGRGIANYQINQMRHIVSRSSGVTISAELGELDGRRFKGGDEFRQIINRQLLIQETAEYAGEAE